MNVSMIAIDMIRKGAVLTLNNDIVQVQIVNKIMPKSVD